MSFTVSSSLLDTLVLCIVSYGDSYGYEINQTLRESLGVSESTLYPVLRRLLKDKCLEAYDIEFSGRNRRYYKITEIGQAQLELYKSEWIDYKKRIDKILMGRDEK